MDNRTGFITITIVLILIFSTKSYAQKGDVDIGGGLIYGSGALEDLPSDDLQNDFGLDVNAYYSINDKIRVGGGFQYFFPKELNESSVNVSANAKYTVSGLYIDGQYIFENNTTYKAYGMVGLTFLILNKEGSVSSGGSTFEDSDSESKNSLNLGGGIELKQNFGNIFIELRYDFQAILGAGVRLKL